MSIKPTNNKDKNNQLYIENMCINCSEQRDLSDSKLCSSCEQEIFRERINRDIIE